EKRNEALGRTFEQYRDDAAKGTLLRRHGTPDEVAACILFLASDDASYVTGTLLFVAGGYTSMCRSTLATNSAFDRGYAWLDCSVSSSRPRARPRLGAP